ncbi:Crp/Fnr family transcriptional regulator [Agrobacterium sp. T29]|uniref:Crp/Fnr family transcriptional regulator n=1 Tax=Agrobacterium sp. T29 TaxID=2580515 RepID=UPI00115D949D|nr:helix-turn-helix domain-containing protein [Agrobacterium sp. T29]
MFSTSESLAYSRADHDSYRENVAAFRTRTLTLEPRRPVSLQSIRRIAFRIVDGCIIIYQQLDGRRRQTLDILGPGRVFSYAMASLENCEAEATVPTRILKLEAGGEASYGELQRAIYLSLQRMQAHATLLGRKTAAERVASVVLDFAHQFSKGNSSKNLTRAEIADYLGMTLETVSRHFGRLKREKLISFSTPEIVTITDREALEQLAAGRRPVADYRKSPLTTELVMA